MKDTDFETDNSETDVEEYIDQKDSENKFKKMKTCRSRIQIENIEYNSKWKLVDLEYKCII